MADLPLPPPPPLLHHKPLQGVPPGQFATDSLDLRRSKVAVLDTKTEWTDIASDSTEDNKDLPENCI